MIKRKISKEEKVQLDEKMKNSYGFRVNSVTQKDFDTKQTFWHSEDPEDIFVQCDNKEKKVEVFHFEKS